VQKRQKEKEKEGGLKGILRKGRKNPERVGVMLDRSSALHHWS